ncbi:hypothetical protein BLL52_1049 [Rhodoferax antarcticus ANT.BR]|uniref:Uncharacterized protein n=2 Tax=Rhodoferax antarcticus TaxID=81479 RepID=A0A1Q8YIR8_9BURK|nr:hypothetical protein RA876_00020 [Rhodoferax antarcticus]OLP07951.1 hypothetical protein BLL52_1049 [Rhodoferax antarcticus ANT.BR]
MNRLQSELHRLYLPHGGDDGAGEQVRAMVLALAHPADWAALAAVWQGVQADLALPAAAIAVSGVDAYQLWFSLAASVPVAQAQVFFEALRLRYLGDVAPQRVRLMPLLPSTPGQMVPALQEATGHWSAFVAPDLASIFADGPWLDRQPNVDGQADLLCRLQSIQPAAWEAALSVLQPFVVPVKLAPATSPATKGSVIVGGAALDAQRFLLKVMNDEAVELPLRIDAAKALLPYTA